MQTLVCLSEHAMGDFSLLEKQRSPKKVYQTHDSSAFSRHLNDTAIEAGEVKTLLETKKRSIPIPSKPGALKNLLYS